MAPPPPLNVSKGPPVQGGQLRGCKGAFDSKVQISTAHALDKIAEIGIRGAGGDSYDEMLRHPVR